MNRKILIVEDNVALSQLQRGWLEKANYEVRTAINEPIARKHICKEAFDLILSDVRLPEGNGISFLEWLIKESIYTPFIIMTEYASYPDAVRAIKLGAKDYLPKPIDRERLLELVKELVNAPSTIYKKKDIFFQRTSMQAQHVDRMARLVASTDMAVLILGANGTGKESVAQNIHAYSDRRNMPFVAVNCAIISKELAPSLFFGYAKGAFTGADTNRQGYFAIAEGGTLFLDEVGALSFEVQSMLLRVVQESTYMPIGSNQERSTNVRIISATNEDLHTAIENGKFREDLYHRLNEFEIHQPSLSECPEDIIPLADFFRIRFSGELKRETHGFSEEAKRLLISYPWPGNIRELRNKVKRAVLITEQFLLSAEDMDIQPKTITVNKKIYKRGERGIKVQLDEKEHIRHTIKQTGGNLTAAARLLGISRVTLYAKLKKYGLTAEYKARKTPL